MLKSVLRASVVFGLLASPAAALNYNQDPAHFLRTDVMDPNGHSVGYIIDWRTNPDRSVREYMVGVGGILGLGITFVWVDIGCFAVDSTTSTTNNPRLKIDRTANQLKIFPGSPIKCT